MGKTIHTAQFGQGAIRPKADDSQILRIPKRKGSLTPEQKARIAALDKFFRDQQEAYEKLSDDEKRQEAEEWELLKKSMNEARAGQRIPYPD